MGAQPRRAVKIERSLLMKKKILASALSLIVLFALSACSVEDSTSSKQPDSTPYQATQDDPIQTVQPTEPASAETLEEAGALGDYAVEIHDSELTKDYNGNPAIIISYSFTNNAEDAISGMVALSNIAFQNGVQLDTAIITGRDIGTDQMKDIKTGATIELQAAFLLTSDTAPVEFEVSELISFSSEKLGKIFEISEGGETVLSVAPSGSISGTLGDYNVSVVSHKLSKDYQDAPAVIVTLGFTNNGNDNANFMTAISCKAFQDGVQLDTAILTGDDGGNGASQLRNVKPGAGTEVSVAYLLTSDVSPIEFEIEEYISFSGDKIETSFDIAQ